MSGQELNETEQIFKEYFDTKDRAEKIAQWQDIEKSQLYAEYMMLKEKFDRLLKTAVRISKLGDKAQQKLIKYKELMDTLRNMD